MEKVNYDAFPALGMEINKLNFKPQTFAMSLEINAFTLYELVERLQKEKYLSAFGQRSRDEIRQKLAEMCGLIIESLSVKLSERQKIIFYSKIIAN